MKKHPLSPLVAARQTECFRLSLTAYPRPALQKNAPEPPPELARGLEPTNLLITNQLLYLLSYASPSCVSRPGDTSLCQRRTTPQKAPIRALLSTEFS